MTAICADVQKTVDFYVSVLGLRFIKKTVNFDVPDTYHIYFGDYLGTPGTAMTFFGWPHLPWGAAGTGQVTTVSFAIPAGAVDSWERRLHDAGITVSREQRFGVDVLGLEDPDHISIDLVGEALDTRWVPWPESPVDEAEQVRGFHSVALSVADEAPTAAFLTGVMGFNEVGRADMRVRYRTGDGGPASTLEVITRPELEPGTETTGSVHHVAWRAADDAHELAWRETLLDHGQQVTPVIERKYFRSIYFRIPGGILFEIATDKPGFTVDEPAEQLGSGLQLPPHAEDNRENLKFNLTPIVVPTTNQVPAR